MASPAESNNALLWAKMKNILAHGQSSTTVRCQINGRTYEVAAKIPGGDGKMGLADYFPKTGGRCSRCGQFYSGQWTRVLCIDNQQTATIGGLALHYFENPLHHNDVPPLSKEHQNVFLG